ncbi:MAG: hypothetical protein K5981_08460 [Clostridia bacterium]|nr:hypothetical protein [Clostridia bacterium]
MNKDELYALLEIDSPADLEYFEQLADLLETEEDISRDLFEDVLSGITPENAGEFAENYLADLLNAIPEDASAEDLTEALDSMQQRLMLLAQDLDEGENRAEFAAELHKFKDWLHGEQGVLVDGTPLSMLEAFTEMRAEKLGAASHDYALENFPPLVPEELTFDLGRFEKIEL